MTNDQPGGRTGPRELPLEPQEHGPDLDVGPAEHGGVVGGLQDPQCHLRRPHDENDQASWLLMEAVKAVLWVWWLCESLWSSFPALCTKVFFVLCFLLQCFFVWRLLSSSWLGPNGYHCTLSLVFVCLSLFSLSPLRQ